MCLATDNINPHGEGIRRVRASHDLSQVSVSFDESNLVANAGLLPAAVLAQRVDLAGLVDARLHLARHGANSGGEAVTVIESMLAGGDSIDDVAVLRASACGELVRRHPGPLGGRAVVAGAQVVQRPTSRGSQPESH